MDMGFAIALRGRAVIPQRRPERSIDRGRALAQDGPELLLERRQGFHQGSGFQRPGDTEAGGKIVGRVVRKMSLISLSIQHGAAPWPGVDRASFIARVRLRSG